MRMGFANGPMGTTNKGQYAIFDGADDRQAPPEGASRLRAMPTAIRREESDGDGDFWFASAKKQIFA